MDVRLPKLGEGAESGVVVSIAVNEGDAVTKGQIILELENEKAVTAIPSSETGTVGRIAIKVGDKLSVGQVIFSLSSGGSSAIVPAAVKSSKGPEKPIKVPQSKASTIEVAPDSESVGEDLAAEMGSATAAGLPLAASPTLRRLAFDLGIDLATIRGSETGGRVVVGDIRRYLDRLRSAASRNNRAVLESTQGSRDTFTSPKVESIDFSKWGSISKKPLAPIRQTIARRMVENAVSIPHVTQFDEADISTLLQLRKKWLPAYEAKGARITVTTLLLKAVAKTLKKFPIFNSSLDEAAQEIVFKKYVHIGMAVDTDQGLLVPVLRNVDTKTLLELSKELNELADKARDRKITLEEMKGGSFTISNQGAIGGGHFTPIINRPEVAILGLGKTGSRAVVLADKTIAARSILPISLSYDHRIIDGGEATRFSVELVQQFENFKEEDITI